MKGGNKKMEQKIENKPMSMKDKVDMLVEEKEKEKIKRIKKLEYQEKQKSEEVK